MPLTTNKSIPGYPILEVNHPRATARIALHGAHLLEWTPAGKAPVIYLSPQAVYHAGQAIRGGIPVCWPWFGPHPSNPDLPSHGFARIHLWELSSWNEEDSGITLTFTLTDSAATLEWWPHAFRLELEMRLGASLHLALRMTNLGSAPCPVSAALHTYFNTADIHQTRVTGLHGVPYHEKIVPPSDHTQKGDITFDREVDRLYASGAPVQIRDAALPRTIII